jgi:hypothetical protein
MRQRLFVADPEGDPPRVADGRRRELFFEFPFSVAQQYAQGGVGDDQAMPLQRRRPSFGP